MTYPIPKDALDDRLAILGTAGSGKTYLALGAEEILLAGHKRVIHVDPLGVAWGLRLMSDGKTESRFNIVIFGGAHGDLPLNEHAGALIGETVATMQESCIIDLSMLGPKAAERRFMLAFLQALYRHKPNTPVHLVIDEADMFAPQKLLDKEGEAAKLLGMMETVVRRGRVKGFIPWLITQRPAVLSKDVLSQADGLIAMKLTSSQDRKAIGAWVESTADTGQWKEIDGQLPGMQRGQGVVWIPGRGVLKTVTFPEKITFDSSRTPERGKAAVAVDLKPLDIGKLQERLAKVKAEADANDPRALKAEVSRLKAELAKKPKTEPLPAATKADLDAAYGLGHLEGWDAAIKQVTTRAFTARNKIGQALELLTAADTVDLNGITIPPQGQTRSTPLPKWSSQVKPITQKLRVDAGEGRDGWRSGSVADRPNGEAKIDGSTRQLLAALAWWAAHGFNEPTRVQVAALAGWRVTSGHLKNICGAARSAGLIEYPSAGTLSLTHAGEDAAPQPDMTLDVKDRIRSILDGSQQRVFDVLQGYGGVGHSTSRERLCVDIGWEPTSGHVKNVLGAMRSLQIIKYPDPGHVALQDWVGLVI